jgi:ribosomal protein S18 acetylase RimI-like enzyme
MPITLRETTPDDENFLFQVYASTRAEEMALVPWTDEQRVAFLKMQFNAQQSFYRERFPGAEYKVILVDGEPVGRVCVDRDNKTINILDIAVLPKHRRAGIGTSLLDNLLSEAKAAGAAVQIHVETFNPSLGLFERLGFTRIAEVGVNYLLEWRLTSPGA